ncbi:hypothetical protein FRC06_000999, partial [Ceratobasidium sp. 370]
MSTYFVKNLNISRSDGTGRVCAGSILTFSPNVATIHKSDVTNSILLAQLVADKQCSRENTANWYAYFRNTLESIGWLCESFSFDRVALGNSPSADQVVMGYMMAHLESGVEAVQTAVDVVKAMSNDDKALEIFKAQSSSSNDANFQVAYCENSSDGNVAIGLGAFVYHINQNIENPLASTLEGKSASAGS